jgi:hypothetical protein
MASAKRTPKVSRISRGQTVAYARKQKSPSEGGGDGGDGGDDGGEEAADTSVTTGEAAAGAPSTGSTPAIALPSTGSTPAITPPSTGSTPAIALPSTGSAPAITPPSTGSAPAIAVPVAPAAEAIRARSETVTMPMRVAVGEPPEMPTEAAASMTAAEDPTAMPGPKQIPGGTPSDPARPPGDVPKGDSRSLRRTTAGATDSAEFALVYRMQTFIITRVGVVGTRGVWRVVEYPTSSSASHAYAKECSRFVSEGFSDYRG